MRSINRSLLLRETLIIAVLLSVLHLTVSQLDLFKAIAAWGVRYERWQLDDLMVSVFLLIIILALFSFRRGKMLGAELERRKLTQVIERKHAENALRESEHRYRELADFLPLTVYEYDLYGRLTFVNKAFYSKFGYAERDFQEGINALHSIAPEDRERALENMKRRLTGEDIGSEEYTGITRNGLRFPLKVYGNSVLRDGRIVGGRGIAIDITEQKMTENAIREAGDRFRAVFNNAFQLTAILFPDGTVLDANQTALTFSGVKREEATGMPMWEAPCWAFSEKTQQQLKEGVKEACGGATVRFETENLNSEGEIAVIDFSLKPVEVGDNPVALLIAEGRDITEQKKAETEREVLREQLAQAQKMEAIGTLAGGIAHDFNNILAAMVGYTELVLNDESLSAESRKRLQNVLAAAIRARELVKQILLFSRKDERQERVALDIIPILQEIAVFLRSSIPSTIDILLDVQCEKATIQANSTALHQILVNLCTNAAQAMEEKGGLLKITVSAHRLDAGEAARCRPALDPGAYVQIEVSDTGSGIDKLVMERIFDPYFTTKSIDKGTGLGLSVVLGIVKQHEGGISVESVPGEGSTFRVFLPVRGIVPACSCDAVEQSNHVPAGRECILIVDDEEMLTGLASDMLSHLGYDTLAVSNPLEALEIFRSNPERIDLVITDFTMPHMTGEVLARSIFEIRPSMPIILATGYDQKISEVTARGIGICEFLLKPWRVNDLAGAVRRALDRPE